MRETVSVDGRRVFFEELLAPGDLAVPPGGEVYVALLWDCDASFDEHQRHDVVEKLMRSGCRYFVCGGIECERWHDAADHAWVILDLDLDPKPPFVMTTWHEGESEDEVVFFAFNLTNFDEYDFKTYLVCMLGSDISTSGRLERSVMAILGPE